MALFFWTHTSPKLIQLERSFKTTATPLESYFLSLATRGSNRFLTVFDTPGTEDSSRLGVKHMRKKIFKTYILWNHYFSGAKPLWSLKIHSPFTILYVSSLNKLFFSSWDVTWVSKRSVDWFTIFNQSSLPFLSPLHESFLQFFHITNNSGLYRNFSSLYILFQIQPTWLHPRE